MLVIESLLKVIWFEARESNIHKLDFDSKCLHEGLPKSIEEVQATIPAKFTEPFPKLRLFACSPALFIGKWCSIVITLRYCSYDRLMGWSSSFVSGSSPFANNISIGIPCTFATMHFPLFVSMRWIILMSWITLKFLVALNFWLWWSDWGFGAGYPINL